MRVGLGMMAAVLALAAHAARADECHDRIAALFDGGALDAFTIPPRVATVVTVAADGTTTPVIEVTFETVTRSMTRSSGVYTLIDGTRAWTASGPDGPWTTLGLTIPDDVEARTRAAAQSMQHNLADTDCLGPGNLSGQAVVAYRYRTRTDPTPEGAWWGALYTVYVDPATGQMIRQDGAERIASWAPTPATDTEVTTVRHDPAIRLVLPD